MLKLGIISAATYAPTYTGADLPRTPGSFHGTAFSTTYNGFDADKAKQWDWTFASGDMRIEGARIVKVWDPHQDWAERLAEACYIDEVCPTPEACCDDVDGVLIVDDGSGSHSDYAEYPLRKGVPTFCDKPVAMTAKRAREVADLAKSTGTPFMTASSLRFLPDIIALKDEIAKIGEVNLATTICGNDLIYYGLHALSMYYGIFGGGAVSCVHVGRPGCHVVRVRFANGCDVVLMVGEGQYIQGNFQINVYGTKGWRSSTPDLADLYFYLQQQFMQMLETGKSPVAVDEEVEVIAVLEAAQRSLAEGREVQVAEVLA